MAVLTRTDPATQAFVLLRTVFTAAPIISMVPALIVYAVIPFGPEISLFGRQVTLYITDINVGLLYIVSVASVGVYGIILAGYASNSKYPLLASLPCKVRWIDSRENEFPEQIPSGVDKVVNEEVIDEIADMPKGSYFIVMTHNHQLDLELTAEILKRNDFAYFGLIGSKTKRVKFEHRLRERGFASETVQRMRCPMGIQEVKGKLPVEIAISIAGEVVATYNANRDLIAIGAYQRGNDPAVDEALERWPEILEFLGQDVAHAADLHHSRDALATLLEPGLPHHKENAA